MSSTAPSLAAVIVAAAIYNFSHPAGDEEEYGGSSTVGVDGELLNNRQVKVVVGALVWNLMVVCKAKQSTIQN